MKSGAKFWLNDKNKLLFKLPALLLAFLLLFSPVAPVFAREITPPAPVPISVNDNSSSAVLPVVSSDPGIKKEKIDPLPLPPLPQPPSPPEEKPAEQPPVPEQTDVTISESLTQIKQATKVSLTPDIDNLTGAMVYKYDISVPAGRGKTTPNIALSYNSANATRNSTIGSGWSLNIPSIERVNKDGIEKLFTENYFSSSLSGELISIDGINYTAKNETGDFLKYQKTGDGWIVTSKDGTKYKFGINAQARQDDSADTAKIFKWMLEEERDTNDNYISYEYFKDAGQIYPSKITYMGNGVAAGIFTINFDRVARSNAMPLTDTGFSVTTNYNINEIRTEINGSWSKKYTLAYTASDNGQNVLLNTITESGKDELGVIAALPATDFDYQTSVPNWTYFPSWHFISSIVDAGMDQGMRFADVNGDGLTDILCHSESSSYCQGFHPIIWLNTGSGWQESTTWQFPIMQGGNGARETFLNSGYIDSGLRLADVNGDGLVDMIKGGYPRNAIYLNNGVDGWAYAPDWNFPDSIVDTGGHDLGVRIADINGDGLSDVLEASSYYAQFTPKIWLNTGSGWQETTTWQFPVALGGDGTSKESFVTSWYMDTGLRLADINGDGLADMVRGREFYPQYIYINNGANGWVYDPSSHWISPVSFVESGHETGAYIADINGDGLNDVVCHNSHYSANGFGTCPKDSPMVVLNTGSPNWQFNNSWQFPLARGTGWPDGSTREAFTDGLNGDTGLRLVDVNGDGLVDMVANGWIYLNNNSTQSNTLTKITYPQGGNTTIVYKATPLLKDGSNNLLNPNLSMGMEVVSQIVNNDGLGNSETNTYSYQGGKYYFNNYLDRKLAGFASISKTDNAGNVTKTYYHQGDSTNSSLGEFDDHVSKIGMPYRVEEYDNAGHLYRLTVSKIDKYNIGTDHNFVKNIRQTILAFDGGAAHKDTAEEYVYDNTYGNLIQKTSWGEVLGTSNGSFTDTGTDKSTENISYVANTTNYVVGLPYQDVVADQNSNKVRESKIYYDGFALGSVGVGNQTKNENWKTGSTYVNTQKVYNGYGLVTDEIDVRGYTTHYVYDSYNLYPATITNPQNQNTNYVYNYTAGKPKQITDPNNFIYQTTFDGLGRPLLEKQPDITNPASLVVKTAYAYIDTPNNTSVQKTNYLNDGTSTNAYVYVDGLGRKFQEKKVAQSGYLTKDYVYNNRGLLDKESLPYNSGSGAKTTLAGAGNLNTTYTYDAMNRVATETNAAGITTYTYTPWKTTITDANGKVKNYYKDAYDNLIKVEEKNAGATYATNYEWNLNKKLTKITDALGNVRNFTYDGLGRKSSAEDLHAAGDTTYGVWNYVYDNAGNMTQSTSPEAKVVDYTYDNLNRILTEDYTGQEGIETTYAYDNCVNGVGKICSIATNAVSTSYSYNSLGGVENEIKNINGIDYQAGYTYDRQGNILEITSPDGSKIKYTYGSQGLLNKIERKENTDANYINVVTNIDYSPAEQPTIIYYANGVTTTNTYDANKLYRLISKITTGPGGVYLQDLSYTYDAVGNITKIVDASNTSTAKTIDYVYDDLNRMTSATATGVASGQNPYTQTYTYNAIGNIISSPLGTYLYQGKVGANYANPHAATSVNGVTNTYDKDGNLISDGALTNAWDYKDRLISTTKDTSISNYYYDQSGARVRSENNGNSTYYVSKYYSVDPTGKKTKNIYAGDNLVSTVETTTHTLSPPVRPCTKKILEPTEKLVAKPIEGPVCKPIPPITSFTTTTYYNHTDHLGSVNVVTDQDGNQAELLDYYPYGNQRISSGSRTSQRQYIGQIYDIDTGLNYLNARYYEASRGQFISQDQMFWDPEKTLQDPQLLNSYSYANNNPILKSDPTGLLTIIVPGTNYNKKDWSSDGKAKDFIASVGKTFNETPQIFDWSGGNNKAARMEAANSLINMIKNHDFAEGEKLNIIGHSHGGNVGILASQKTDRKIDNLVTLGTPARSDYQPNYDMIGKHTNVYSNLDPIQIGGGQIFGKGGIGIGVGVSSVFGIPTSYGFIPASRKFDEAENIGATWQAGGAFWAHSNLWQNPGIWSKVNGSLSNSW